MAKESREAALQRMRKLEVLQDHYANFIDFLEDAMELLGYSTSDIQEDIARFLAFGPKFLMVQAQRGQAKTTITAAFAVWSLIMEPRMRILILSAGGKTASEISTLIIRLLENMEHLDVLRADPSNGDRTSIEAYDVHYSLKGVDKSPSVACIGITGTLEGKRADLLIADDVESKKNSKTALMREQLLELTKSFSSLLDNSDGRIVYLGTPQSRESIYNSLPGRGFTVRIWPGRYPTQTQLKNYGDQLAPLLLQRMKSRPELMSGGGMLGDQGQPVDSRLNEFVQQEKETDQGTANYQLQYMLSTAMTDALRYPLKTHQMIQLSLGDMVPMTITRDPRDSGLREISRDGLSYKIGTALSISEVFEKPQSRAMYIDPAGGGLNGDETAYAFGEFLNGNVFLKDVGGVPGGYDKSRLEALAQKAAYWKPEVIIIEKNMGFGAFKEVFIPVLHALHKCKVEDDMVSGQKELRIIETLEPVINAGKLIIADDLPERDYSSLGYLPAAKRAVCSFFHQLSHITRDRGSLAHDDRVDAVAGLVNYWLKLLAIDQSKAIQEAAERQRMAQLADPLGHNRYNLPTSKSGGSVFNKYRRF